MKKQLLSLLLLFCVGCASKPQVVMLFTHQPIYPKGFIELDAGVELFKDLRPEDEKKATEDITDLSKELTVLITKDLRDAELFQNIRINYNPQNVDIILEAEINSFYWKSSLAPTAKLPYIQYIHSLGVSSGAGKGKVEITFILLNAKTNQEIVRFKESAKMERKYSSHDVQSTGGETAQALREVVEKFIEDILKDKNRILNSLNQNNPSPPAIK